MKSLALLLGCTLALTACGGDDDDGPPSPYDGISPEKTIRGSGLSGKVDIVRDVYGVPHVYANTEADAAFGNGYIVAHDRMLQLELLRNLAKGTIGEIFGALDPGQIDSDLSMRMHRIGPRSEAQIEALRLSSDALDQAAYTYISRFSDGVNAYIKDLKDGKYTLDGPNSVFLAPDKLKPWTPADSVALGLFQTWSLSYDDTELRLTRGREKARDAFDDSADPARQLRAGAFIDLFPLEQLAKASTIDGWPNLDTDSGTRAKRTPTARPGGPRASLAALDRALRVVHPIKLFGQVFAHPEDGSNNWVVGPSQAGGKTLLANDPHLTLSTPSLFHAIHITVPGKMDVAGISLAGVPGVVLGYNNKVSWGATTAYHDVLDWSQDTVVPCTSGGGNCVVRDGAQVKLEEVTETFNIGGLGQITDSFTATYEVIPGEGPVLPNIVDHRVAPRPDAVAISARYTGYAETHELRAIYKLDRAGSLDEAFTALDDYEHGAQGWVIADEGHIGFTSTAKLPRRAAACFAYHPVTNPYGEAPFFVSDGASGACKWTGFMDPRYVPHAIDPDKGWLATANADYTGESFDGDLLNGPIVDGAPLYAGYDYNSGLRIGRITERLTAMAAGDAAITIDDLAALQADTRSNVGVLLRPAIVAAGAAFAEPTDPAIVAFKAGLSPEHQARLTDAIDRLEAWTLATPAAVEGTPLAGELTDSIATSIFNFWQVAFYNRAFADELALVDELPNRQYTVTTAVFALTMPEKLVSGLHPDTGEAVLCDDLATTDVVESCTLEILMALDDALTEAETIFDSADATTWLWGKVHTLTLEALVPASDMNIPPPTDPTFPNGFPRHGDAHAVDVSNISVAEYDFTYSHGPAMRFLVEWAGGGAAPKARLAIPGGEILDTRSPHFRDLVDKYWRKNEYFEVPHSTDEIIGKAETRWVIR